MDDLKTLSSVIITSDGSRLKQTEELAIVIGLAVEKIKRQLKQEQKVLELNRQRLTIVLAGLIIFLALIATWWVQSNAIIGGMTWVIGGTIFALLAAALLYIYIPRSERFSIKPGEASITYIGQFYWPLGILPLSHERSLLWDALTPTDTPLQMMPLSADWALEHKVKIDSYQNPAEGLATLLEASQELAELKANKVVLSAWPSTAPDESLQQLGQEVSDLWEEMRPISADQLASAIRFSQDKSESPAWQEVTEAGRQLQAFYFSFDSLQALLDSYRVRSEQLLNAARDLLLEHGWRTISDVEDDRAAHFPSSAAIRLEQSQEPSTIPNAPLRLTATDSRVQIEASLAALQTALLPLDAEIAAAQDLFKYQQTTELQAAEEDFNEHRQQLTDLKKEIEATDSAIFNLIIVLEDHQNKLHQHASLIQHGTLSLAQVPLAALQTQVEDLYRTIHDTSTLIRDSNLKLEFISVESSLERLKESLDHTLNEWQTLSQQMPQHSTDVTQKVEMALDTLKRLVAHPQLAQEKRLEQQIQGAIKDLERVPRALISWTAQQQNPIDAVEDNNNELSAHLVALREHRHKLELASENLTALSYANSGRPVTLPESLQQIKNALLRFTELSEESQRTILSMDEVADLIAKQADMIGELLKERDALLESYRQKVIALQDAEIKERHQIRQRWQDKRDTIEQQRADLNRLQKTVQDHLNRPRIRPNISQTGMIMDPESASWPDRVVNLMNVGLEQWGQRIAGIDLAEVSEPTELDQLQHELEECYEQIKAASVPIKVPATYKTNGPELCFIPFWYVESQSKPKAKNNSGRMIHIFPPQQLREGDKARGGVGDTQIPTIEKLAYHELSKRLLSYLRHDDTKTSEIEEALSFAPASLSDVALKLDLEAAAPSPQTIAGALAQYWVLFRSLGATTDQIIKNSRDQLIPEAELQQILEQEREGHLALSEERREIKELGAGEE